MEKRNNNNSIAKNTLFLYFRMIIIMAVQLFTVRVVLNTLGETDYGIYNVVGGVVSMFSFLAGTMTTASQRYFAFEIGRNDMVQLKKIFSLTLLIYCFLGILILILGETIGLWFLNHKLKIPAERLSAANWVYQFALLTFMLTMFQIPYDAMVIAREKMNVFAYVSILEVLLKLGIVYLLTALDYDKLKMYSVLIFVVTLIITTIYKTYSLRKFKESHFTYYWNKALFREILSYSGWNLFGASASVMNNQGINIVLNIFFGPAVNAARALAFQINSAINGFVQNFMTATRPQITKYYAQGDIRQMLKLVFQSSKFSFYLLFLISIPLLSEMPFILKFWLNVVPNYAILFARIILITALVDALSLSIMSAIQATGKIKIYQIVVGGALLLNVPIAYIFLKLGLPPQSTLYVVLSMSIICLWIRLILMKRQIPELSIINFIMEVIIPVLGVSFLTFIFMVLIEHSLHNKNLSQFIIKALLGLLIGLMLILLVGINKLERQTIKNIIKMKLLKKI